MNNEIAALTRLAAHAKTLRLFLDYDGTLAEFAASPETVTPDKEVIALLNRLVSANGVLPAIISGRRLAQVSTLLPVRGLLLGGTYGIEMQLPDGRLRTTLPFEQVRPTLERLLPHWQALILGHEGFFLEDKGWSLALHARFALPEDAASVMAAARIEAQGIQAGDIIRLQGNDRFLELAPRVSNKAATVQWILDEITPDDALIIYLGDDDKDEEAFSAVLAAGGWAVRVTAEPTITRAQVCLHDPIQVRAWLGELLAVRGG